jgi:hypothetical protein
MAARSEEQAKGKNPCAHRSGQQAPKFKKENPQRYHINSWWVVENDNDRHGQHKYIS